MKQLAGGLKRMSQMKYLKGQEVIGRFKIKREITTIKTIHLISATS